MTETKSKVAVFSEINWDARCYEPCRVPVDDICEIRLRRGLDALEVHTVGGKVHTLKSGTAIRFEDER